MELVSLVSVVVGSTVLTTLAVSIAIGGIKRRSTGTKATTIHALDSGWGKLKVDVPA